MGSTAVPGLAARPVIDILAGVESLEASLGCFRALKLLGYGYSPYLFAVMHSFCRPSRERPTHQLQLVPRDSWRIREEILFRDRLRACAPLADQYVALKRTLASRLRDDPIAYTEAKAGFIRSVLWLPRAEPLSPELLEDL